MGNAVAYIALFTWPIVGAALFSALPRREAVIWTVLGGYLLLPQRVAVDLPLLPAFDRTLIPGLAALVLCLAHDRQDRGNDTGWLPANALVKLLFALFLIGPVATVLTNRDTIHVGGGVFLAGQRLYDAGSFALGHGVLLVPFLLGRRYLGDAAAHATLLKMLVLAGLLYSLPMLFEVRMSPQLHTWIYGFFPHSFLQQMRFGGFRPVVFLSHGLVAALFAAMTMVAAVALARSETGRLRSLAIMAAIWLSGVLVLCKTVGALVLGLVFAPVAAFLSARQQILVAGGCAIIVLIYPVLRGADLVPVDTLLSAAARVDGDRAQSLGFRFRHEDSLLARANERALFGWGGWGRSRVYDPVTGEDVSVSDGRWVITVGQYGWMGYLAEFGLLTAPVFLLLRRGRSPPPLQTTGLIVVLTLNLMDLLPNAGLSPLTWLIAGALTGAVEERRTRPGHASRAAPRHGLAAAMRSVGAG